MLRIEISAESVEAFRAHVADLYSMVFGALATQAIAPSAPAEQPTKRTRAKKEAAPEVTEQQAKDAAKIEAAAPAALRAAQPAVEALFGGAQQAPAPVEAPKATQKDLIAAFRALAEAKGTAPVVEIITKYGVKSVALIPEAKWGEAVALAQAATK